VNDIRETEVIFEYIWRSGKRNTIEKNKSREQWSLNVSGYIATHATTSSGTVVHTGTISSVRLEGRELEVVWASAHRSRMSGPLRAARRREALGLPRVSDREAERSRTIGLEQPGATGLRPVLERGQRQPWGRQKSQRRQYCRTQFEGTSTSRSDMSH